MAKELQTAKVILTNVSRGPRGVNTASGGTVVVERGATSAEIEMTVGELASLRLGNEFTVQELGPGTPVIRYPSPVRASKLKVHGEDIAALKAEIAGLKDQIAALSTPTDDRDALKKQADDLGIDYPKNIPTEKLKELIDAKVAESA